MAKQFETYNKEVMKRFLKPKFSGEIKNPDAVGETMNDNCGDMMRIFLKIKNNKINVYDYGGSDYVYRVMQ